MCDKIAFVTVTSITNTPYMVLSEAPGNTVSNSQWVGFDLDIVQWCCSLFNAH